MDDLILELAGENCNPSEAEALEVMKSKSLNVMNNLTQQEQAYHLKANAEKSKAKSKFYKPDKLDPSFYASYDLNSELSNLKNTKSEQSEKTEQPVSDNYVTDKASENAADLSDDEDIEAEDTNVETSFYATGAVDLGRDVDADADADVDVDADEEVPESDAGLSLYCGSVPSEEILGGMEGKKKDDSDYDEEEEVVEKKKVKKLQKLQKKNPNRNFR